ncbi:MAG: hypothetical protein DI532_07265 [Azospirillum brasilense]|nr:MAG: hypothetical protein DI532_07265 [Azospirillum brasilense]
MTTLRPVLLVLLLLAMPGWVLAEQVMSVVGDSLRVQYDGTSGWVSVPRSSLRLPLPVLSGTETRLKVRIDGRDATILRRDVHLSDSSTAAGTCEQLTSRPQTRPGIAGSNTGSCVYRSR